MTKPVLPRSTRGGASGVARSWAARQGSSPLHCARNPALPASFLRGADPSLKSAGAYGYDRPLPWRRLSLVVAARICSRRRCSTYPESNAIAAKPMIARTLVGKSDLVSDLDKSSQT